MAQIAHALFRMAAVLQIKGHVPSLHGKKEKMFGWVIVFEGMIILWASIVGSKMKIGMLAFCCCK